MRLPVVWLTDAVTELQESVAWYAKISPRLAERFEHAVAETVEAIVDGPQHYQALHKGVRRAGVRRFPYGLFFFVDETQIVVTGCFHGKRHPKRWQQRM